MILRQSLNITLFILLLPFASSSQSYYQKTFGGTNWDYGYSVQQTADGGFIITGETNSFGQGNTDVYLLRTDNDGDTIWIKTYGGSGAEFGFEAQETSDGGFILTGKTTSFGAGAADVYLIKTNSSGDIVWAKTYGGVLDDYGYSVEQTTDDGYIVTGWTQNFGVGGTDLYLIRTDSNGDTVWTKTFRGTAGDYGRSVKQTNDGGFIVGGFTGSFGAGSNDIYLIRTDSNGDTVWTKTFGGTGEDYGYSVQQTSDSGYIVTGSTNGFGPAGTNDNTYFIKTDASGILDFSKVYSGGSGDGGNDYGYSVIQNSGGGYAITGSTNGFGGSFHSCYLLRTNSTGTMLGFATTYGSGSADDYCRYVQQTSDGGYIMAGYTESYGAGGADVYVIKTDANGDGSNTCGSGGVSFTTTNPTTVESNTLTLSGAGADVSNAPFVVGGTTTENTKLPLGVLISITNITCFGNDDGIASASVAAGTAPYTYNWSFGAGDTSINDSLPPGSYALTVVDNFGCAQTDSFTITEPPAMNLITTVDSSVNCSGSDSSGVARATITGGTSPFNYSWSNGSTTFNTTDTSDTATGLYAGTFFVTVTDANSCTAVDTIAFGFELSTTSTDAFCGSNNGSASVTINGGTSPYTYAWSDPSSQTTSTATSLLSGSYTVVVTDSIGCQDSVIALVNTSNGGGVITVDSTIDVNCNGGSDGAIYVTVTDGAFGTPPYTYLWSTSDTTDDISNLTTGSYVLQVTDSVGCITLQSVTINEPSLALSAVITDSTDITCNGAADGTATVTVSGGTTAYTYSWSPSGGSGSTGTSLSVNTYSVNITDANGCTTTSNAVTIGEPAPISLTTDTASESCFGNDGKAWVIATGGTGAYTYLWSDPSAQVTDTAFNLTANTYNVTVTDSSGCSNTSSATILQSGNPPVITVDSTTDITCNGGSDGAIYTSTTAGNIPYTFSWSPGGQITDDITGVAAGTHVLTVLDNIGCVSSTSVTLTQPTVLSASITSSTNASCSGQSDGTATVTSSDGIGPFTYAWSSSGTSSTETGLLAGTYSVTVTDACGDTASDVVIITEPGSHSISISSFTNVSCNGGGNGSAAVSVSGGSTPYTYIWNTTPVQSNATAINLSAGTWTVTVIDSCGNSVMDSVNITEPQPLSITVSSAQNVSCFGGNDGNISIILSGGTTPYSYLWSNAATTSSIFALITGTYSVVVTDSNGCTALDSITITQPQALSLSITSTDASCGNNDGTALVSSTGGSPGYMFSWNTSPPQTDSLATGLGAGTYSVTVTDFNDCSDSIAVSINQPPSPMLEITNTATPSCTGDCDAATFVDVTGGISPLTYSWDDPASQSSPSATGLCAGIYLVTVTGGDGCFDTISATIADPAQLVVGLTSTSPSAGICDGTITANVAGGTGAYTYLWNDPTAQTTQIATELCFGSYGVTITDSKGCEIQDTTSISEIKEIFLPTAFSPNGDGVNNVWYLRGDVQSLYLVVFNRWGEKVFETRDRTKKWDGTHRGKALNSDSYSYYLNAVLPDGEELILEGNVLLVR